MNATTHVDPVDIMALAQQGKSARQIADTLDCHISTVYAHAHDMGITVTNPVRTPDYLRKRARKLRDQGWTLSQIADDVGRSRSWVSMHLRGQR